MLGLPSLRGKWLVLVSAGALALAGAVLWVTVRVLGPLPPRTVTMTTGPEGSAYHEFGLRYRAMLAREGIEVRLLHSAGSVENLARLRDPEAGVDIGFLQGGTTSEQESPDLMSLGTVFYEPLWIFHRGSRPIRNLEDLLARRISIGPEGSGTRKLALELLAMNGVTERTAEFFGLSPSEAGEALQEGRVDAVAMVSSWEAPVVRRLLAAPEVELLSAPRADAYVALRPYLNRLVVPAGVGDLATNHPPADVLLLAPKASLVVRVDLHPAIQYLLVDAAIHIHASPGIFSKPGEFPAPERVDLPVNADARRYYQSGAPFLQRYLPFWMAVFVARAVILLIPVVAVLYPLVKMAPGLYDWQMRHRIYRLYGELKVIDADLDARDRAEGADDLRDRFAALEARAHRIRVPLWYAHVLYALRLHMNLVRDRLERWPPERGPTSLP